MVQKAFLKSSDGIVTLTQNATTVGKENCDITIDDSSTDHQHAVIEHSLSEDCFVLHDLNSTQGTYVNNCRVQNSAVRLAHGDHIQFGHGGKLYELHIENPCGMLQCLPVQQRPSWSSPIQIVVSSPRNATASQEQSTFPLISVTSSKALQTTYSPKQSCVQPHPPLLSRPRSAEMLKHCASRGVTSISNTMEMISSFCDTDSSHQDNLVQSLRERECKVLQMGDEINRLAIFEQESKRKDIIISSLRQELAHLQSDNSLSTSQVHIKLQSMEKEIALRHNEVEMLRDQLNTVSTGLGTSTTMTSQLAVSEKEVHSLRQDLDASRKECAMAQVLVKSLQQEVQCKDDLLKKCETDLLHVRKETRKKDIQLSSLSSKFTKLHDDRSKDEAIDSLKREIKDARIKLRICESRSSDQLKLLQNYKDELSKLRMQIDKKVEEEKASTKQIEEINQKYLETQRAERILRVDLEQCQNQFERFRARVVNTLCTSPDMNVPEDIQLATDNDVIDGIKKSIRQRMDSKKKLESMMEDMRLKQSHEQDFLCAVDTCKTTLTDVLERIKSCGRHTRVLKSEVALLTSLAASEDRFGWMFDLFAACMRAELEWTSRIDEALSKAGYDTAASEKNVAFYVDEMHNMLLSEKDDHQRALTLYGNIERRHKEELQINIEKLLKENEEKLAAEIERVRSDEEERFQAVIQDLQHKEEEKRLKALHEEKEKVASANLGIDQLRKLLGDKQNVEEDLRKRLQRAHDTSEQQKNMQHKIHDEMNEIKREYQLKILSAQQDLVQAKKAYEADIKQCKEEIHQHSITIVAMEKQIRIMQQEKAQHDEKLSSLKASLKDAQVNSHHSSPPLAEPDKKKAEEEVSFLKAELFHSSQEVLTLKNTIVGLRRDLAGSQSRLSDMSGELSESQKMELERNRSRCKSQELELNTLRQKLIKMSSVIDSQDDQMKTLQTSIKRWENEATKYDIDSFKKAEDIKGLEEKLETLNTFAENVPVKTGKISEELSSVGAQCRGERHEEIISRQSEALAELRARVKALEHIRPPLPGQEQALQQVILLKKELSEIRAKQALDEDKHFRSQIELDKQALDKQEEVRAATVQASIERSVREHLEVSLDAAEKSYLDLLNNLSMTLGITSLEGSGTMLHLPSDERDQLSQKRKKDLDRICSGVKSVLQQLDRKDQLLQGYEKDLNKLRDAERFASDKSGRVAHLTDELRDKCEEVEHLREALNHNNERLELEKRLNKAIKQRKTFHLEQLNTQPTSPPSRSIASTEVERCQRERRKLQQKNKMKRKQYEIDILKERIYGKEKELCSATARLVNSKSTDEAANIHSIREENRNRDLTIDM